ncbi:transcription factor bHLH94-like isoform X1 [Nicotiana tabacum]|uniref:Transcription factor bHLH94-like isoform X1 n=1 Tax=Nicotiana tabacum TaxID=4097 RepID=A0A1S3YS14_TOBAC|nr:PREDICTED: transcription factor bHLH96-like [Nicotiana tabacum]
MALETVVYPQEQFGYFYNKEFYASINSFHHSLSNWESSSCNSMMQNQVKEYNWDISNFSAAACNNVVENQLFLEGSLTKADTSGGRRKRRRTARGSNKNREELENQRMTHIAVERNRRKQMNEYLTVLRSLMPSSYVQRADQASIIGGAINFVKKLEQHLQTLEAQKRTSTHQQQHENGISSPLFADFFSFPQYSTTHSNHANSSPAAATNSSESAAENRSVMADIEVNLVESHANLKILSKRRPKQLLKIVAGLQCLSLTILHLNVTTVDQMVLYTLSAKVEEGCQLTTVEEIAQAVNQLLA